MSETITYQMTLDVIDCPTCSIPFGVTRGLINRLRKNGKDFYCPSGHHMSYGDSEADKLRKEKAALARKLESAEGRAEYWIEEHGRADKKRQVVQGQLTKTKKRIAGGACPCCKRSFVDLGAHMETKHPDYVET